MIPNKVIFEILELIAIFGEDSIINPEKVVFTTGISIDTRILKENNIFIALKGEKIDAHSKVKEAFDNGASICVVNKSWYNENSKDFNDKTFILVNDTINALSKLAKFYRAKFKMPIIAIGGSNGKTSTKEMVAAVLSKKYKVLKTFENFNNHLGVPLMLFQLNDDYDMAVLEIGTNHPGEIVELSEIVKPTDALVTNIGKEHLEFLIDLDGVELEETSLYNSVRFDGHSFINFDDERLRKYTRILEKCTTYGSNQDAMINVSINLDESLHPTLTYKDANNTYNIYLQTFGFASALNAIAALTVGIKYGLEILTIKEALEQFEPLVGHGYARMAVQKKDEFIILNDCYNANPSSMSVALDNLFAYPLNNRKIAVLGDMKEMGETSVEEHKEVLLKAIESADLIFTIGNDFNQAEKLIENSDKHINFLNKDDLIHHLNKIKEKGDIILFKGSRSMKLEQVIDSI